MGFGIRRSNFRHRPSTRPTLVEPLERRQLLSLVITSITADNRGEVQILLNNATEPGTVSRRSVMLYTAGDDGIFSTADDEKARTPVGWYAHAKRIVIRGNVPANTPYRVKVVGSRIWTPDGEYLDGDYHGSLPSGNDNPGGNLEFQVTPDTSDTPEVRMSTTEGVISLKLFRTLKPASVANFLSYADSGAYDDIFWTRSVPGFVLQGGALQLDGGSDINLTPEAPPIVNEFQDNVILSNTRGTVAFAKQPGDPDSATNQFFVNLGNNGEPAPYGLDFQNGGFTVFARAAALESLVVMDRIASYPTVAMYNPLTGNGEVAVPDGVNLVDTPIAESDGLSGQVETVEVLPEPYPPRSQFVVTDGLDPGVHLITIKRTALLTSIVPLR